MYRYFFSLLLFTLTLISPLLHAGELSQHTLSVNSLERSYLLYQPDNLPVKAPLMLVLHGGLGNGEYTVRYGMNELADREGFMVAYPDGNRIRERGLLGRNRLTWNAGDCCGRAAEQKIDDVAFLGALIDHLVAGTQADPQRVWVTGMSNGAMMTYRLVCELPDRIAAAVPVAGALVIDKCPGGRDIPLLHIHGAEDQNVPITGGKGELSIVDLTYPALTESLTGVAAGRDCETPATETGADGIRHIRLACHGGAAVSAMVLPGVEHTWPGASLRRKEGGTLSANEIIWDFVSQYSRSPD